jgi:hypothetical protein
MTILSGQTETLPGQALLDWEPGKDYDKPVLIEKTFFTCQRIILFIKNHSLKGVIQWVTKKI